MATWTEIITKLRQELQDLSKQREYVEMRLVNVSQALQSLAREIEDPKERAEVLREIEASRRKPAGLTESISNALRDTRASLSPNEIRKWLELRGFDLSDYSQPLATVSVTLRRMAKSGRVKASRHGREVRYGWIWK